MIFVALPEGFPALQTLMKSLDSAAVARPPEIEEIGLRLRRSYARARADGYRSVSAGELRKLPYAYWVAHADPLPAVHPDLVRRYWDSALPAAAAAGPRRAKRWLMPLFFVYCEGFAPRDQDFSSFAERIRGVLAPAQGELAARLRQLDADLMFFSPRTAASRIAGRLLDHDGGMDEALGGMLLWPSFVDTKLGTAVLAAALSHGNDRLSRPDAISRLLEWAGRLAAPMVSHPLRVEFANGLLMPWTRTNPPDAIRSGLLDFFLRTYGDPRIDGNLSYQWKGVSERAVSVIKGWLAGDTLRAFIKVLERTADDIWRYRQKFWMAYYDAGYVQDAWLALGNEAAWLAKRLQAEQRGLGYGRLEGGAAADQSVLILRIGDIVFTEWSHNGSLRAYRADDPDAPALYQRSYQGRELRDPESMDFHGGANMNPELRHMNSQGGTWQRKARDFIRRHTGVRLEDRHII
jgi:hypothetical protein